MFFIFIKKSIFTINASGHKQSNLTVETKVTMIYARKEGGGHPVFESYVIYLFYNFIYCFSFVRLIISD